MDETPPPAFLPAALIRNIVKNSYVKITLTVLASAACFYVANFITELIVLLLNLCLPKGFGLAMAHLSSLLPAFFPFNLGGGEIGKIAFVFQRLLVAAALTAGLASRHSWRVLFPIRFPWTWTLLLLPFPLWNLFTVSDYSQLAGVPSLVILGLFCLAIGVSEEVFFRGFAFLGGGDRHPRYTVLLSSLAFSLMHLNGATGDFLTAVLPTLQFTFVVGMGLGVVRIVTGSIAWGVVVHFFIDFALYIFPQGRVSLQLAFDQKPGLFHALLTFIVINLPGVLMVVLMEVLIAIALISSIVVLIWHPAMKPKSVA